MVPAGWGRGDLRDGLVDVRVECAARRRIDFLHVVAGEDRMQFLLRHLDAAEQVLARFGERLAVGVRQGSESAGEVVGDIQEVARELADAVDAGFGNLAFGPLAGIVEVRVETQELRAQFFLLGFQPGDHLFRRRGRGVRGRFARCFKIGGFVFVRYVAHDFPSFPRRPARISPTTFAV